MFQSLQSADFMGFDFKGILGGVGGWVQCSPMNWLKKVELGCEGYAGYLLPYCPELGTSVHNFLL